MMIVSETLNIFVIYDSSEYEMRINEVAKFSQLYVVMK